MADVILINCPITIRDRSQGRVDCEGDEFSNPPLGLLYLAASLKKDGFNVTVMDPTPQGLSTEDIIDSIGKEKPVLVGLSAMTPGIKSAVRLATKIREAFKDYPLICIGGAHINSDPEFINRFSNFDFAVVGEAELTIVELVKQIKAKEKPKGVIYAKPIDDLDVLPLPARGLIDIKQYRGAADKKKKVPPATMITSRGCPFQCSFCSRPVFRKKLRVRSPKNIVDEMESIAAAHDNRFSFVDDTLTLNRKTILGVCDEIIKRKLKFKWMGMTRATSLDDELAAKLRQAGCDDLFIGVESGNERIRNEVIKKNVTDQAIFDAIRVCRKNDIHTNIFLILGFPTETHKEIRDTITFGRRCKTDLMGIKMLIPLPGADIFDYAIKNKIIPGDLVDRYARGELGEGFVEKWPLFVPKGLKLKDLITAKKKAYINFYFDPKWAFRRIKFYIKHPSRLKDDMHLFKVLPHVLKFGKTESSMP